MIIFMHLLFIHYYYAFFLIVRLLISYLNEWLTLSLKSVIIHPGFFSGCLNLMF